MERNARRQTARSSFAFILCSSSIGSCLQSTARERDAALQENDNMKKRLRNMRFPLKNRQIEICGLITSILYVLLPPAPKPLLTQVVMHAWHM